MRIVFGIILLAASPALGQVAGGAGGVAVTTNTTVSTLTTGTVLQVTPAVSADGHYVTMGLHPSYSSLEGLQSFGFGGGVAGGASAGLTHLMAKVPYRPAVVGSVTFVETDKKLLAVEVPAMTLTGVSLEDAGRKLADATKGNIVLGIRGLKQAGVDVSAKKTFVIAKGTLKDALLAVLKVAAPDTAMVISAEDNVVQVATQAQADHNVVTKTYYLDDLLANLPRIVAKGTDLNTLGRAAEGKAAEAKVSGARILPESEIPPGPRGVLPPAGAGTPPVEETVSAAGAGGTWAHGPAANAMLVAQAPLVKPAAKPAADYSTTIAQLIASTVRPEIWKINGGKIGEIAVVGDRVTIRAPASVQAILDGPSHHNPNAAPMNVMYGTQ